MTVFLTVTYIQAEEPQVEWISAPHYQVEWRGGDSKLGGSSADGRYVVFQSQARLHLDDDDSLWDIYLLDRRKGELTKITRHQVEAAAAGPTISPDGEVVAYHVYPESVMNSEPPRYAIVHLYFRKNQSILPIQNPVSGDPLDGESLYPVLSQKGDRVVFTSNATNAVPGVQHAVRRVYEYDVSKRSLSLLVPADRMAMEPDLDRTGRIVAFKSAATNLTPPRPGDALGAHLYVLDRNAGTVERIDDETHGWDSNRWMPGKFDMDRRGRFFVIQAYKKIGETPDEWLDRSNIFVFDRKQNYFTPLSEGIHIDRSHFPAVSGNGRYAAYVYAGDGESDKGGVVVWHRRKNRKKIILNGECRNLVFSYDGEWIFFESRSGDWTPEGPPDDKKIFAVRNPWLS